MKSTIQRTGGPPWNPLGPAPGLDVSRSTPCSGSTTKHLLRPPGAAKGSVFFFGNENYVFFFGENDVFLEEDDVFFSENDFFLEENHENYGFVEEHPRFLFPIRLELDIGNSSGIFVLEMGCLRGARLEGCLLNYF